MTENLFKSATPWRLEMRRPLIWTVAKVTDQKPAAKIVTISGRNQTRETVVGGENTSSDDNRLAA